LVFAGLGLIFVGIDLLQDGLSGNQQWLNPEDFAISNWGARFILVLIGVIMTVLVQSSSVAVAATLTALHTGSIGFDQAAALVIGQNIGTTFTTIFASLGATVPAKRTAAAHIAFNVITGIFAFIFLPSLVKAVFTLDQLFLQADPAIVLATFHTGFNLLGILLVFPVLTPFSKLIEKTISDDQPSITRFLDKSVQAVPSVAVEAARNTFAEILDLFVGEILKLLHEEPSKEEYRHQLDAAMEETTSFLKDAQVGSDSSEDYVHRIHILHAIDHLSSVFDLEISAEQIKRATSDTHLALAIKKTRIRLEELDKEEISKVQYSLDALKTFSEWLATQRKKQRAKILDATASGLLDVEQAQLYIETFKTLDSLMYHLWRIYDHLSQSFDLTDH
jgi:phosphate:Na+ symporter